MYWYNTKQHRGHNGFEPVTAYQIWYVVCSAVICSWCCNRFGVLLFCDRCVITCYVRSVMWSLCDHICESWCMTQTLRLRCISELTARDRRSHLPASWQSLWLYHIRSLCDLLRNVVYLTSRSSQLVIGEVTYQQAGKASDLITSDPCVICWESWCISHVVEINEASDELFMSLG